ncbi:hypothetical protein SERLA73DRAFT_117102 [Serpula lacrymans var. lacrymans S7.3]|uniref:GPI ethanolamine phosphate transferase 1 n=2 Tax=Serpula lacrymans var. lacrymans TaxID=341189 RepID=F8QGH6_SERL3|nr:uncharacterized protein SERLADRAFT_413509 [Serpula lacrymans var. lacrymans S7.9]EGN92654.1 hypothetical protein SERLA73DRAFT_117102 [Serpula lacrymans var. lacrymans S7.3]EGO28720.1 hypothetical protein SERLADRAFT_413509 [Serpula lacrymans var. lacrymans S7.9]
MSKNPNRNVYRLLAIGLVFHLVFLASVFDCYFASPVVHGMIPYRLPSPESKRLVLIVADGLRADLLFTPNGFPQVEGSPALVAPHLRSIAEERGAFGVSHTRVPTESRPGHVAIIGGMYEDVSAVTKGWKTNPVDFDSVFNRSSHTFSFGSPDILPMFARGATPGRVRTWSYEQEVEDFTKDATALDVWVLDQLHTLFKNATLDGHLNSQLHEGKVVFFMHLLGLDTTGHSYRPHSKEYMSNIQVVDRIVHDTEQLFSEFYGDDETSFLFTADHGMSKIGNHGDGDPDNTRTPVIAWGKGIRGPVEDTTVSSHDDYSQPWGLNSLLRRDVEQADLALIMASLIGIEWPVNAIGVLPDVDPSRPGYLLPRDGEKTLAHAALVNAQVIVEHYRIKHELKASHVLFYKPFSELESINIEGHPQKCFRIAKINRLIEEEQWYEARRESFDLINSTLKGLRYLETYDRLLIRAIVVLAYLGWAAYTSLFVLYKDSPTSYKGSRTPIVINSATFVILLGFWVAFAIQKSRWTFYLYIAFPCYFWQQFALRVVPAFLAYFKSSKTSSISSPILILQGALVVAVLQCMVAAYTRRFIWSVGFALMGLAWPSYSWPGKMRSERPQLQFLWALSCLVTGIFPLLSVDKKESLAAILLGGFCMLLVGACYVIMLPRNPNHATLRILLMSQTFLIALSMAITVGSVSSLQAKLGLPLMNQVAGWTVLATASLYPFVSKVKHSNPTSKILTFFLGFAPLFVILSISVEGLFYMAFSCTLLLWVEVEAALRISDKLEYSASPTNDARMYQFQADDVRIALFFLFFVQAAFFGIGNVASISSFYLEPVYRLLPIFNPFLMATLLIFKIVAPYVILSATFATLNARLHLPPFSLFLVALTLTDGMTMTFFLNVTDTGSWLEIGQSISFFCITSLLLVWSAGICAAGEYLMVDALITKQSGLKEE